jgi:hypothetical protein
METSDLDWELEDLWNSAAVDFRPAMDIQSSVGGGNQIAFSSLGESLDVWSLPLAPGVAKPSSDPQRLTADTFEHSYSSISLDGNKIAYSSRRSGTRDIWVKDLVTGKETVVSIPPASAFGSVFSTSGDKIAY